MSSQYIIIITYLGLLSFGLFDNLRGAIFPAILNNMNLSATAGSQMFAIASFAGIAVMLKSKYWLAKVGCSGAVKYFLAMIVIGAVMLSISGRIDDGYWLLILASVVLGAGLSGVSISSNLIISKVGNKANARRLYAGLHSMYGLSALAAPISYGIAVKMGSDWRDLLIICSALPLTVIIISLFKNNKHDDTRTGVGETVPIITRIRVGSIFVFYVAAEIAVSSRIVYYVTRVRNVSDVDATPYLSLFFLMLTFGRVFFSLKRIGMSNYRVMMISLALSLALTIAGIMVHPIFLSLTGLTMAPYFPCAMDWMMHIFRDSKGLMVSSMMIMIAIGLMAMHTIFGFIADLSGARAAMMIAPLGLLLGIMFLAIEDRRWVLK